MSKGKFIVFEGIEGSGKSTQVKLLTEYLQSKTLPVYQTREASDGPIGKILRSEYLSGKRECDKRLINLLYVPDRLDHITNTEDGILMKIENGFNVISDRYYMSSAAIHSSLFTDEKERIDEMIKIIKANEININLLKPDITFYIDTDPVVANQRVLKNRKDISIFDNIEYMKRQQTCYENSIDYIRNTYKEFIFKIDGNRSIKEVQEDIIYVLNDFYVY